MPTRRVLIVGSGGREHALAWRLARDDRPVEVLVAPGNDAMERSFRRLAVSDRDVPGLVAASRAERVDLVVVGPEVPLAAGLADALAAEEIAVFGPSRAAAALESSKWFAKEIMREAGVPTGRAAIFESLSAARAELSRWGPPWVIKADGLAAGKGVRVTGERAAAEEFLVASLEAGRFGESGRRVVMEEFLEGEEASVMAVCDGERFLLLPAARDYKRAADGDLGPNTGGMGAYAPAERVDAAIEEAVAARVVAPVLAALRRRGTPFRGTLYCGMMLCAGGPKVVEFNARFGDPESQVVLPLMDGDWLALLESAARGKLNADAVRRSAGAAVAVALVDERYPEAPGGGGWIAGLEALEGDSGLLVFHAATRRGEAGRWEVVGGRAAWVVARAPDRGAARERAYGAIGSLGGSGWRCRRDIAGVRSGGAARRERTATA